MFDLSWQDAIFTIGNLAFFVALIPSILSKDKPSKWTSLSTAITLTLFSITYLSLGFLYATIATALTATAWWILYFQKIRDKSL